MGLIKTAILTGGGIYAVNKLVKSQEARHSNQQNNNQNSRGVQQEGYWGPPGLPPNNDRSGPQYQQQWYPANPQQIDQQRGASPQNNQMYQQPRGSYSEEEFEEVKRPYTDGTYQQRDGAYNPPPSYANAQYAQPQYPQQQYLPPPQWQGYNDGMNKGQSSTMDKLAPLAGVAMGMVASNGSGSGSGRKGRRGGGGLISGLLSDRK